MAEPVSWDVQVYVELPLEYKEADAKQSADSRVIVQS